MTAAREVRLAARPRGMPSPGDFAVVAVTLPPLRDAQVLVRNLFLSVDPYMRSRMDESMVHMAPFEIGAALDGAAVGEVLESRSARLHPGDLVVHGLGWRDLAVLEDTSVRVVPRAGRPVSAHLGILGMPGFTAWYGLGPVGGLRPGETVFVSAAAGAVGSTVGQLVKQRGGRVIGSTGSQTKARWLVEELGFDAAFDYRSRDCGEALRALAPDGVDVYFDNVGGAHLDAALAALKPFGRVVACGMIAQANRERTELANLPLIVGNRLSVTGFVISDHEDRRAEFTHEAEALVASGALRVAQTVVEGLDRAPHALIGLLSGENTGKMLVAV